MEPDPPRHPPFTPLHGLLRLDLPQKQLRHGAHWLLAGGATMVWLMVMLTWLG